MGLRLRPRSTVCPDSLSGAAMELGRGLLVVQLFGVPHRCASSVYPVGEPGQARVGYRRWKDLRHPSSVLVRDWFKDRHVRHLFISRHPNPLPPSNLAPSLAHSPTKKKHRRTLSSPPIHLADSSRVVIVGTSHRQQGLQKAGEGCVSPFLPSQGPLIK